jgi:hypothetical protein
MTNEAWGIMAVITALILIFSIVFVFLAIASTNEDLRRGGRQLFFASLGIFVGGIGVAVSSVALVLSWARG